MLFAMERRTRKDPGILNKSLVNKTEDSLRHFAFDNSLQANIISEVSNGKIIIVNNAACKLLGYSKKNLLSKDMLAIFGISKDGFKKMMKLRNADGHATAVLTVLKENGKPICCEVTSAMFRDEQGVEKAITTLVDISQSLLKQKNIDNKREKIVAGNIVLAKSKQKSIDNKKEKIVAGNIALAQLKSDIKEAENNEWKKSIGKTSYDVMWDWNITSGQIYVGESIEEVFGYKVGNNTISFANFKEKLLPEEKDAVEKKLYKIIHSTDKKWVDSFKLRCSDGTFASTISRAAVIRDKIGKAQHLLGAIKDVTNFEELENNLGKQIVLQEEGRERFLMFARLSFDVIWDWDLDTDNLFLGEGFEELFGHILKNNKGNITDWSNYLYPDDKVVVKKGLTDAIASTAAYWEDSFRYVRADGSIARVFNRGHIIRHADGKAYRMIGVLKDLSYQKELEEKLEQEIKIKEEQIIQATEDAKDMERSDIGKELHDNVNQLLSASRMYLEMAKRDVKNSELYLSRSHEYILTAIEEIRKLTKGLTTDLIKNLGLGDAIGKMLHDTMQVNLISITCDMKSFNEERVNDKFKLNIFRIVQEQLKNILTHAQASKVTIRLLQNKKLVKLTISDNGIGFDTVKLKNGIGIINIKSRAATYKGTADFISLPGHGVVLTVIFPVTSLINLAVTKHPV